MNPETITLLVNYKGVKKLEQPGLYDFGRIVLLVIATKEIGDNKNGRLDKTLKSIEKSQQFTNYFFHNDFRFISEIVTSKEIGQVYIYMPFSDHTVDNTPLFDEVLHNIELMLKDKSKIKTVACDCTWSWNSQWSKSLGYDLQRSGCGGEKLYLKLFADNKIDPTNPYHLLQFIPCQLPTT